MKSITIIQPYFLPYLGYFQLINYVDLVILYDNVQYTKKGWINRNKIIRDGKLIDISIPLKKGSSTLNINERYLSENWPNYNQKILEKVTQSYQNFKYFKDVYKIINLILSHDQIRLDKFLANSIMLICKYLNIKTKIIFCSSIDTNTPVLKSKDRILSILKKINCEKYVNPIGGKNLYDKKEFAKNGIKLEFLNSYYTKNNKDLYPKPNINEPLSVVDLMMKESSEHIAAELSNFTLE